MGAYLLDPASKFLFVEHARAGAPDLEEVVHLAGDVVALLDPRQRPRAGDEALAARGGRKVSRSAEAPVSQIAASTAIADSTRPCAERTAPATIALRSPKRSATAPETTSLAEPAKVTTAPAGPA